MRRNTWCNWCGDSFSFDTKEHSSPPDLCRECQEKQTPTSWEEWVELIKSDKKLAEDVYWIVTNTKAREATDINNAGAKAQLTYLREAMTPQDLEAALLDCLETQDDGRFDRDEEFEEEVAKANAIDTSGTTMYGLGQGHPTNVCSMCSNELGHGPDWCSFCEVERKRTERGGNDGDKDT